MAIEHDEDLPDDEVQTDDDQHPDDAVDVIDPAKLPEDSDALREFALEQQREAIMAKRDAARLQREAERHKEDAKEQRTKADYWTREAQRKQGQAQPSTAGTGDRQPAQSNTGDVKSALKGLDLASFVAMDDGVEKLVGELEQRGVIVTQARLNEILNKRVSQERTEAQQYRGVVARYKDLEDPESELAQEAALEFEQIIAENPGLENAAGFELAASRAAQKVGYTEKPKPNPQPKPGNDRLRRAQGGPVSGGGGQNRQPAQVTDSLRKMATKTFGSQVDDKVLQRVAQRVAANQKRASNG
jgi:hypothetical protein